MAKKNIITNLTLEKYEKKYTCRKNKLSKHTKKEVEDFDKKNHCSDKRLLKGHKWALIKDTYYQIPKAPSITWFRNLRPAFQIVTCVLGIVTVSAAIAVPTIIALSNIGTNEEETIKVELEHNGQTGTREAFVKTIDLVKDKKYELHIADLSKHSKISDNKPFCLQQIMLMIY